MKIFVKMKKCSSGFDIPHSINIATAMYGFNEMGFLLVPYYKIDEIYDLVSNEDIVLDYIEQCNTIFNKFGINPYIPNYPKEFEKFLGRKIWKDNIDYINNHPETWGCFVKPIKEKVFTGKIINSPKDLIGCGSYFENYEVICSDIIDIKAEWRCFILYDEIIGVKPYGFNKDIHNYHYNEKVLNEMLETFKNWKDRPKACSIDICLTDNNKTLLVEFNDAYALGCYGLDKILYAKLISARWSELLKRQDECNF